MASASLKDVAKEAGVSLTTVSRILNNDGSFSDATRKRVLKAVDRLKYVPRLRYRNSMKQFEGTLNESGARRTRNIALVCDRAWLESPPTAIYHVDTFREMALAAQESGFSLLITVVNDIVHVPNPVLDEKVDAVICRFDSPDAALLRRMKAHVPVVLVGCMSDAVDVSGVKVNEYRAHRKAIEHLLALGHRRIAYLNSRRPDTMRYEWVKQAFQELNAPQDARWTTPIPIDAERPVAAVERVAAEYMESPDRPTAVLTEEFFGFTLMHALRARGVRVPEDMSVVVIGDNLWALHGTEIAMTAVRYPMVEIARWAVEEAMRLVEDPERPPSRIEIDASLFPRASSGPAPALAPSA